MRRTIWTLWIAGLTLKLVSSAWDVSWHFALLRESISPPHVINLVGFVLIALAFLLSWRARTPTTQPALNVTLVGFAVFLVAIPFDEAWHRVFGIDITTWSPSHLMLFYGTTITIAGVVLLYLAEAGWRPGQRIGEARLAPGQWAALAVLLLFLYEAIAFPLSYNEYSAIGAWNYFHGFALYTPGLELREYASLIPDPYHGNLPHLLYPAYALAAAVLFCVLVRQVTGVRGSALGIMTLYALERAAANGLLHAAGWPTSALPWYVILVGAAVEVAWLVAEGSAARLFTTLVLALAGAYGYWWEFGRDLATGAPVVFTVPLDWSTLPWAALAAGAGFLAGQALAQRLGPMVEWANRDPTPYAGATAEAWLTARR
ncbi:MAG: hypothetical protein QOE90_888 [Thermoplasmata archaeon]|jgi:hypothetical protein|nr:hypothetical protein [Thermoplasmata archaeon]